MRAAVGDQAHPGGEVSLDDGARDGPARRLQLEGQAVEVLLPVLGPLAVARFLVVAGAAREVGRQGVLGAGDGPVADAVAVHVLVPLEAAQPLEVGRGARPCRAGSASPDRRTGCSARGSCPGRGRWRRRRGSGTAGRGRGPRWSSRSIPRPSRESGRCAGSRRGRAGASSGCRPGWSGWAGRCSGPIRWTSMITTGISAK